MGESSSRTLWLGGILRRVGYTQRMLWVLGAREGIELPPWPDFALALGESRVLYGGVLWPDLISIETRLTEYHERLTLDFSVGWSAVAFTARGVSEKLIGRFAPPTVAMAHASAPFGLYLLSADRLRRSFDGEIPVEAETGLWLHRRQAGLGNYFCDPNLEVTLSPLPRDFHYRPPSRPRRALSALKTFARGRFDS